MVVQKVRRSWRLYRPFPNLYFMACHECLKWLHRPAIDFVWLSSLVPLLCILPAQLLSRDVQLTFRCFVCRQLGWNARLLALVSGTAAALELDYLLASWVFEVVLEVFTGKSAVCHLLLKWIPWGSFMWCVGALGLAVPLSRVGFGSLSAGWSSLLNHSSRLQCSLPLVAVVASALAPSSLCYTLFRK